MALMTKRERVLRTVRFAETDRVPIYDLLQNQPVIEHFAGEPLTIENGKRLMGVAIAAALDMTRSPGAGPYEPALVRQENGLVMQRERWTTWIVERPWQDIPGLIEWIKGEIRRTEALAFDRSYVGNYRDPRPGLAGCLRGRRSHRPGRSYRTYHRERRWPGPYVLGRRAGGFLVSARRLT